MSSPLAVVAFVLRDQPDADCLLHLAGSICSYLGPSPSLSLHQACSLGSLQLLDWIWDCSCTSPAHRTSTWSLTNFLRSDPHYSRYQFAQSMKEVADRSDLEMVKWLFTHFSDCQVPWEATVAAAGGGNLPMLQFLLANDAGRRDREQGGGHKKKKVETMEGEIQAETPRSVGGGHVVTWGPWVMPSAKRGKHPAIVQWLKENVSEEERATTKTDKERQIVAALEDGDDALAKTLMPPGRCVLDYAAQCSRVDLIEMMLDCGYIQRDRDCANSAIRGLSGTGRLDLMQQVVLLYSPPAEDGPLCIYAWNTAIQTACGNGYLAMLQWLMEHPLGQILRDDMRRQRKFSDLVCMASYGDHADVIQYVYDIGANVEVSDPENVGLYAELLFRAVRYGRYNTTKWLVEHVRFPERGRPVDYIIETAVTWGRFDILKLFHEMDSAGGIDLTQCEQNQSGQVTAWWAQSQDEAINMAAEGGHLEILQWLLSNRSGTCTAFAMDRAAGNGKLETVQWLHANRSEGCTTAAMDRAAGFGCLDVVKWLHANRSEGCSTMAMDMAARGGHLKVVKWLYANRSEGCTANAIENALVYGHVAVANWLRTHFPELRPSTVTITSHTANLFEVLLFLHEHFSHVLTPQLVTKSMLDRCFRRDQVDIVAWLAENQSSQSG